MDSHKYMKDTEQLLSDVKKATKTLLEEDTLKHLPQDVTLEEIKSEIQLQHGHSIILYLKHGDGKKSRIVVPSKNTTVIDLKKSIKRQLNLQLKRTGLGKQISWKYVWKAYWLSFDGIKLTNDNLLLSEIGLESQSEITFVKRLKDKIRIR
uniref:U11/U12 small nuclear ribonucleoprotein 25 kDa protein n=1 Tax=Cacopsylla melanoneura TaxID=428564 RepID=A0A8D8PNB8_9HEMI